LSNPEQFREWSFNQRTFDFRLRLTAMGPAHIRHILWGPNNPQYSIEQSATQRTSASFDFRHVIECTAIESDDGWMQWRRMMTWKLFGSVLRKQRFTSQICSRAGRNSCICNELVPLEKIPFLQLACNQKLLAVWYILFYHESEPKC